MHYGRDSGGGLEVQSYYTYNHDLEALANQVAEIGLFDYVTVKVMPETGFVNWDRQVVFNNGNSFSYNGTTVTAGTIHPPKRSNHIDRIVRGTNRSLNVVKEYW